MAWSRSHRLLATLTVATSSACSLLVSVDGLSGIAAPVSDADAADADAARNTADAPTDAPTDTPADAPTDTPTPVDASVAIRLVQLNSAVFYTQTTKYTCAFMTPVTKGSALVVGLNWSPGSALVSLHDNQNNVYLPAITNTGSAIYYVKSAAGGTVQVSASFTIDTGGVLFVHEYEGLDPNQPLDQTNGATGTSQDVSSGPVTTTAPHELIFSFARADTGLDPTPTPGFKSRVTPSTGGGQMSEDLIALSTGTFSGDYTRPSSAGRWTALIASFRGVR